VQWLQATPEFIFDSYHPMSSKGSAATTLESIDLPAGMALMQQRRSTRAFLPDAVPDALLHQLLLTARQAPSGGNLQPGQLIAVRGKLREQLTAALLQDVESQVPECEDYAYFPRPMPMQLRKRQVASAQALYGALGVARDDRAGREAQFARNYRFFDAPVALVVTIDAHYGPGGYMDLGMTLYGLQLAPPPWAWAAAPSAPWPRTRPPCAACWAWPRTSTSSAAWPWAGPTRPPRQPDPDHACAAGRVVSGHGIKQ
jgi:nitroreductase